MMIRILCVGKIRESFYRDACAEYIKRLGRYVKVEVAEVPDEKTPDAPTDAQKNQILMKEGERVLARIREDDYVCALAIKGRKWDSEGFSRHLGEVLSKGRGAYVFVIGGSLGLSETVLGRADESVSFSEFTFPHMLMRVILLEQIYRGMKILKGEPYHK